MQPAQQPPQGFQWDPSTGQSGPVQNQMIQGQVPTVPTVPNYATPMTGGGLHGPPPSTNAAVALVISLVGIVGGLFFMIPALFSIVSLLMANSALKITAQYPNHPDHGVAKAAQILSIIVIGIMLVVVVVIVMFVLFLSTL